MDASAATNPAKDPHLPSMGRLGDVYCPRAPQTIADAKLDDGALVELAVKTVYTINRFTIAWLSDKLRVGFPLATALVQQMISEGLIEETLFGSGDKTVYRIGDRGRQQASRAMESSGYVGPAPVSLEAYQAMVRWQFANTPEVKPENVTSALSNLILTPEAVEMAGLAVSSGRSLFVYGPSGNGKSSLGRAIHTAMRGDLWMPYSISVRSNVIRLFDEQVHQRVDIGAGNAQAIDQRWVRVRRPFVVVGGELTLEYLDLVYSPALRYYEAPPHLKANGGVFLVDDFGRERVSPHQLLNRFITPMEHNFDYFTLVTGQKIQVPLRQVLIIATNLSLETVTDPAFLRRMGYRLMLEAPTPDAYSRIFTGYAAKHGVEASPELLDALLAKYQAQNRDLRACEPRDLIERARDICRFRGKTLALTPDVMDLAWTGYFGNSKAPVPKGGEAAGVLAAMQANGGH